MSKNAKRLDEEFVRLALAINEHLPGYVDAYLGPTEWNQAALQDGKLPISELKQRVDQLAANVSHKNEWDMQRKDFLTHQVNAMQMSLRLLAGENLSLAKEAQALYDVQPVWMDESDFVGYQELLDETLPQGGSLRERLENWNNSLEISIDNAKELLPFITRTFRELTRKKFDLPDDESFSVEFVSNQTWMAYNRYLGEYKSRIEINTDIPMRVNELSVMLAHEGYPGHHTEFAIKEAKLIRQMDFQEHFVTLINSPSCVISEGIARSALETVLTNQELEDFYREEILPRAEMTHLDAKKIIEIQQAEQKIRHLWGNAAFMLHDQKKSMDEVISYLRKYEMSTEQEANRAIQFMSGPLDRSYIFTYTVGYDLLKELFNHVDRDKYFARLLEEPVTPSQIRAWIQNEKH